jgi:uncharacterized membrane protein (DUF373 family)
VESVSKLKEHYFFTEEDERNLARLAPAMEAQKLAVGDELYHYILSIPSIAPIMEGNEAGRKRHRAALGRWFSSLFAGKYDQAYFLHLQKTGSTHVRIGLKGHYVNAAMSLVRNRCHEIIQSQAADAAEQSALTASLDKILDMNLDIMTSSYREAELRKVFFSYKMDEFLLRFAERFSFALKLVLVLSLMGISVAVVGLFVGDVVHLFQQKSAHGVLGALGSLLIIWVMVELMENEIRQLRGGNFRIQVFLGVALVALIRELLIASLEHAKSEQQLAILAGILTLGVVHWLISRADPSRVGGPH